MHQKSQIVPPFSGIRAIFSPLPTISLSAKSPEELCNNLLVVSLSWLEVVSSSQPILGALKIRCHPEFMSDRLQTTSNVCSNAAK